jgi:outer membrane protein assembly factor BamB
MKFAAQFVLVLMCGAIAPGITANAADWPEFRGPTRQGHAAAANVPVEWGPDKNIAWKSPLAGQGWSSPVVVGDRLYLTLAIPDKPEAPTRYELSAAAIDAQTGKSIWTQTVFTEEVAKAPQIHAKNSHASPTPIVEADRLYVHFGHMGTACLTLDGQVIWRNDDIAYEPVHGNGGSPAIVGNSLIFSCDGADDPRVVALDKRTGKPLWTTPRPGNPPKKFSFCTPLAIELAGKTQVILPAAGMVGGYDPQNGAELWRVFHDGYSVIPRPLFADGLIYISTGYDSPSVLAIRAGASGDATDTHVAWTYKKAAPHTPSMIAADGLLYMVSDRGVAACVDAKTGEEVWAKRLGGNFSASPVLAGGKLYFLDENGKCHVVATGKTFKSLAVNELPERTLASLAVVEGAIFLRGDKFLYRIQASR